MSASLSKYTGLIAVCVFALLFQSATFIGFEGWNDDSRYIEAARGWLTDAPFVGHNHWSLRHPYVLSLAASLGIFGPTEFAAGLPSLICYVLIVGLVYLFLVPRFGMAAGVFAALSVAIVPVFAIHADSVVLWPMELLLIMVSFGLLWLSGERKNWLPLAIAAGIFAGLAFLSRATSAAYLVGLLVLFLFGLGAARKNFIWMAVGFFAVLAVDTAYFYAMTGDLEYRFRVITNHGTFTNVTDNTSAVDISSLAVSSEPLVRNPAKKFRYLEYVLIDIGPILSPWLMLFVHYLTGLTYWGFAGCCIFFRAIADKFAPSKRERTLLYALLIIAAAWLLTIFYGLTLRPHPRYWAPTNLVAAIFGGLFVAWLWEKRKIYSAICVLGVLGVGHLMLVQMNASSITHHRWLADYVEQNRVIVHIPAAVHEHGRVYFSKLRQVDKWVRPLPDQTANYIWVNKAEKMPTEIENSPQGWDLILERQSRTTWLGEILGLTGIVPLLPDAHRRALVSPEANIALYRRR